MALITTNNESLKNLAIIAIKDLNGIPTATSKDDLTIIKVGNEIVGINVFNYQKYFDCENGSHTLTSKQYNFLKKAKIDFKLKPFFKIGEIVKREKHPKSKKLFILEVMLDKKIQIVTNSLNSLVGKKIVVAMEGAILPSGLSISSGKVMGVLSEGMLCGGETLGLEKTDGVLIVNGEVNSIFNF